jgi:hypothetical protein
MAGRTIAWTLLALLAACGGTVESGSKPDSATGAIDGATGLPDRPLPIADAPPVDSVLPAADAPPGAPDAPIGTDGPLPMPDAAGAGDAPPTGNGCIPPTALTLSPMSVTRVVSPGEPFSQPFTAMATYAGKPAADVTAATFFTVSDATIGAFTANVFEWSGAHGGTITVTGHHCGAEASVTFTLELSATFSTPGVPPGTGGDFGSAPPSSASDCQPQLVYPPDGVLVPPNMNVIEVHFTLGAPANERFEISFSNAATDVRVYTTCAGASAADGMALGGGCVFELDQAEWDFIARSNRDGDPVSVRVRGLGCDGDKAAAGAARALSFAKEDLVGALFYWASLRITDQGTPLNSGGVFKYDFGARGASATPVLTPDSPANSSQHNCIGCHDVSKDGRRMVFDFDDNNDDDEIGDVFTDLYDLINGTAAVPIIKGGKNVFPAGYHTWNHETTQFLLSDGPGDSATPKGAFRRVSPAGATLGYTLPGSLRGTTPDWSPDDSTVVFAVPPNVKVNPPKPGYWQAKAGPADDLWFAGASLYTAQWDLETNQLGAPALLLAAAGTDNYFYPSFSPEGSLIVFDHAASGANFHNPLARIQLVPAGAAGATPVDLSTLNTSAAATNSWARWSPFVQSYKSGKLLWITMSSTRDYGLRVQNDGAVNCYPVESPIGPFFTDTHTRCARAQLWMAAIDLDPAAVASGTDVSHVAFWLPFQELTTNNHLAQWAERSFTGPCQGPSDCAAEQCCSLGGCTTCPKPPPPPPPMCSMDANCAPGACCVSGACVDCPPPVDAGVHPPADAGVPDATAGCATCIECPGQACVDGTCTSCTSTAQCCAGLVCVDGSCLMCGQGGGHCDDRTPCCQGYACDTPSGAACPAGENDCSCFKIIQ